MKNLKLENLALSENGFLFDTFTGNTYTLNKTGKIILKGVINGDTKEKITEDLISVFDIANEIAVKDVEQFVFHLKKMNVIPE